MKKKDFIKGMMMGIVAGAALGMALCPEKKKKSCKSMVADALRSAGDVIESAAAALGL